VRRLPGVSLALDHTHFLGVDIGMNGPVDGMPSFVHAADHGWANDDQWHDLDIPLAAFGLPLGQIGAPFILSGGLNPENVAEAIAATSPFAVDTASGTEVRPGVKDPERLRAFAAAVAATAPEADAGAELAEHHG